MLTISDKPLTIYDVVNVARNHERVELSQAAKDRIVASRAHVDKILNSEQVVYGISTGFGEFSKVFISPDERGKLQHNLIISHCTGVGELLPEDAVRAITLLRVNSLSKGYSGIRLSTVEKLIEMLNKDIYPAVPSQGSVGSSGDLAPLSHIAIILIGQGFVVNKEGKMVPAAPVLKEVGFEPIELAGKEGLALNNGTQVMTGIGALACYDAEQLLKIADIAAAMSMEALRGIKAAFDPRIAQIRPHLGQIQCAENVLALTQDSVIIDTPQENPKVQDAYSLRCVSQIHGASREAWRRVKETVDIEMNAVTDNPLVMPDTGEIISGGNFHGQPMALAMDYLKIALSELANISERRINRLVDPHLSGLPAFLTAEGGVNSGMMINQYTAASLVSENKVLAHPASVDSIPTSANQEDHVSMGTIGARQSRMILENTRYVLAIELLAAAQGIDFQAPMKPGKGTAAAHSYLRSLVPHLAEDRMQSPDMQIARQAIVDESLVNVVEKAVGTLK